MKKDDIHRLIDRIFRILFPALGMAERADQISLSHLMFNAMLSGSIALSDAGTGTGKTYAYLVAGIAYQLWRSARHMNDLPVIVSTSSIALQKAIVQDYLPLLSELLTTDGIIKEPLRAVIRKGKHHYVCDYRLNQRLRQANLKRKNGAAASALTSLQHQLDLDEVKHLSNFDRELVCVPDVCHCRLNVCQYRVFLNRCASERYRFQICNHNLLLADASHRAGLKRPILPESCAVIIDEAHKLPEAAHTMFGVTLDSDDIRNLAESMKSEKYYLATERLQESAKPLLKQLDQPREDKPFSYYARMLVAPELVLRIIGKQINDQLSSPVKHQLEKTVSSIQTLCSDQDDLIYYTDDAENGGTRLCATVSNLSKSFQSSLWNQPRPFVLTSATMAIRNSFQNFRRETGLTRGYRVIESTSPSPFDFKNHCLLYFPKHPAHKRNAENKPDSYYDQQAKEIHHLLDASFGHALVLFTSYQEMSIVKEKLIRQQIRWKIFVMDRSGSHTVALFKEHPGSVLFAAGAAWEGFDFPGDCVSLLVIPRLPFAAPTAVKDRAKQNYTSLRDFIRAVSVPEMQIKLKQGFGRAIRTETDTCAVAVLDERAVPGARYHTDVLNALPEIPLTQDHDVIKDFIRRVKKDSYFQEVPVLKDQAVSQ